MARLQALDVLAGKVPRAIEISADANVAPAMAKLEALRKEVALSESKVGISGSASLPPAAGARSPHRC